MSEKTKQSKSIIARILIPMLAVVLAQPVLFFCVVYGGGTFSELKNNNYENFDGKREHAMTMLENMMTRTWGNLAEEERSIEETIAGVLAENGKTYADISRPYGDSSAHINEKLLLAVSDDILYLLRKHAVTDAFIVLDGPGAVNQISSDYKAGIYLRDNDPGSASANNSDVEFLRGRQEICGHLGVSSNNAKTTFEFHSPEAPEYRFYFAPVEAARGCSDHEVLQGRYHGYWSPKLQMNMSDTRVVSYSIPLASDDGEVYGVIGVGVSDTYLNSVLFSYGASHSTSHGNALSTKFSSGDGGELVLAPVGTSGMLSQEILRDTVTISIKPASYANIYRVTRGDGILGSVGKLRLYSENSPFADEEWYFSGFVREGELLAFYRLVVRSIFLACALSLVIATVLVVLIARHMSTPIEKLSGEVQNYFLGRAMPLDRTNIKEVDELADAFLIMSKRAEEAAAKVSDILAASKAPIGVFEREHGSDSVFVSSITCQLLGWEYNLESVYMSSERFDAEMDKLRENRIESAEDHFVCRIVRADGADTYAQIIALDDGTRYLGVVIDATKEVLEKEKIEYERDYDVLTGLLNRRSFMKGISDLFFNRDGLKTACMLMWDLDNLKYVNDTYGHEYGDKYIQCLAGVLKEFRNYRSLVTRISGDEFNVFLYGYDSREEIEEIVSAVWSKADKEGMILPNGEFFKLRASAGKAFYPDDADSQEQLIQYSDFAMYSVKRSKKGAIGAFDRAEYEENAYIMDGQEELNAFLEERRVRYAFQPIVNARTGEVLGYEALMRPQTATLRSPLDIMRIATQQAKLYLVEDLTWKESLAAFRALCEKGVAAKDARLFVNSIPDCILGSREIAEIENEYSELLSRVVLEIMENEPISGSGAVEGKLKILTRWGGELAVDDFGTGYNGNSTLLLISPKYVKIDISIVHGIDLDLNRRKMFWNMLNYLHGRNIEVIAEGVETQGELKALIGLGVDFVQGFYLAMPQFEPKPIEEHIVAEIRAEAKKSRGRK